MVAPPADNFKPIFNHERTATQRSRPIPQGIRFLRPIHRSLHRLELAGCGKAYLHPVSGVLTHDLHDENVVRIPETGELAVIDPYISLARQGTWAAIKLAEVGYPAPPDDAEPS